MCWPFLTFVNVSFDLQTRKVSGGLRSGNRGGHNPFEISCYEPQTSKKSKDMREVWAGALSISACCFSCRNSVVLLYFSREFIKYIVYTISVFWILTSNFSLRHHGCWLINIILQVIRSYVYEPSTTNFRVPGCAGLLVADINAKATEKFHTVAICYFTL